MAIMPEPLARDTVAKYACAQCWSDLQLRWVTDENGNIVRTKKGDNLANVFCRASGKSKGFVTKSFIEKELMADFDRAYMVKKYLRDQGLLTEK